MRDNLGQVSRLVAAEVTSLRHQCEREKETAQRMKTDADNVSLFKQWRNSTPAPVMVYHNFFC